MITKKEVLTKFMRIAFTMIIAGGIGNILDRIFRGYVIDYIDVNKLIAYPVFNFADILVVVRCNNIRNSFDNG
jgi:signal peptidase II